MNHTILFLYKFFKLIFNLNFYNYTPSITKTIVFLKINFFCLLKSFKKNKKLIWNLLIYLYYNSEGFKMTHFPAAIAATSGGIAV